MSDFVIPDMIEPIVAWRAWRVSAEGIHSLNDISLWPKRERRMATCPHSEPTEVTVNGWEAVPHRGEPCWVRDGYEGERLVEYVPQFGPGHAVSAVSYAASAVAITHPTIHIEPLPESPSALLLPVGWRWRIGQRSYMMPPWHTESPAESCTCGIYALKSRRAAKNYGNGDLYGEVYLWGKVIEAEDGYRAQYAYPKSLTLKHNLRGEFHEALRGYEVGEIEATAASDSLVPVTRPWWRIW